MKVAWTLIVAAADKANAVPLNRALASINGYVDEIFIQLNAPKGKTISPEVRQVAERFTSKIYVYEWRDNFVDARNALFAKVPKSFDWVGWMDTDDVIAYPENIARVVAIMPKDANCIHIMYDYQKDEYGNVVVAHWSARLVRNNNSYHWKSSFDDDEIAVHETLVPRRTGQAVANDEFKVIHMAEPGHQQESLLRNISMLEAMYDRQSESDKGADPRILYYLGSHYWEAGQYEAAKQVFIEYLKLSGWSEERAEAHLYMGKYLQQKRNLAGAKNAFLMALGENPKNPNAYLQLGRVESKEQRWDQAAEWFSKGLDIEVPISAMVQFRNRYELLTEYAQALINLGGSHLKKALTLAQEALELRPDDPDALANRDNCQELLKHRSQLKGLAGLLRQLHDEKHEDRIVPLLSALPDALNESPLVIQARQANMPVKVWPRRSMAIYVGMGPLGNWGPWSMNEGGTGGSEEAVIRLSQELAKMDWIVEVFGMPGTKAGLYDKVGWRHYWEFNPDDKFDVLVIWRQPAMLDHKFKARKKYLWLHDVMPEDELIKERITNVTKVIYVSKYHAERPENAHIKGAKKLASGNGIAPDDFTELQHKSLRRNPQRCIYMSANERGLRILYDIWPAVRKQVPNATLDVFYGWNSFDAVNRDNPERMLWKAKMQARAAELKGVTEHGRVGQDQLNEEIFQSGIFAYPCSFPEVNCITAQKAMAGGAIPVTSDFAVLKDIIDYGEQVPMHDFQPQDIERYKQRLIWWLKHPEQQDKIREEMQKWAKTKFAWANTAVQWHQEMV